MNNKYGLYVERVLAEHNRYYFMRNVHMEVSIALEKANELQQILKNKINEEHENEEHENEEHENEVHCAICLESMKNKSIVKTSCNHTFCLNCVERNKYSNKHTGNLCPICRNKMFT
jgi:ATP-dependent 26S proteasome regulatory subunit